MGWCCNNQIPLEEQESECMTKLLLEVDMVVMVMVCHKVPLTMIL